MAEYLVFYGPDCGPAAKLYAQPIRHRRHRILLREISAWHRAPDKELCTAVIVMAGEQPIPAEEQKHLELTYCDTPFLYVSPGDAPWEPTEAETLVMGPLNQLRHDAALLGIEIDTSMDADRIATLINGAQYEANERASLDAERDAELVRAADKITAELTDPPVVPPVPATPTTPPVDRADPLFGIDLEDVGQLREVAKALGAPVNGNRHTKAATIVKGIRAYLGVAVKEEEPVT